MPFSGHDATSGCPIYICTFFLASFKTSQLHKTRRFKSSSLQPKKPARQAGRPDGHLSPRNWAESQRRGRERRKGRKRELDSHVCSFPLPASGHWISYCQGQPSVLHLSPARLLGSCSSPRSKGRSEWQNGKTKTKKSAQVFSLPPPLPGTSRPRFPHPGGLLVTQSSATPCTTQ